MGGVVGASAMSLGTCPMAILAVLKGRENQHSSLHAGRSQCHMEDGLQRASGSVRTLSW